MPTATLITADELLHMPDDGKRREIVRGELIVMAPASGGHGEVAAAVASALYTHVKRHSLGKVYAAETGFVISRSPDTVRAPDAAFVSRDRIQATGLPSHGFVPLAPDLAVEVLSPDDRQVEVEEKVQQWLDAGTKAVWVVNPRGKTLTIHRAQADPRVLRETNTLHGDDVVPGFELKIADIFA